MTAITGAAVWWSMTDRLWQGDPTVKQLRDFAVHVGAVVVLIGALLYWRNSASVRPYWIAGAGITLGLVGLVAPAVLKPLYQVWMAVAFVMGRVMTTVLLTIFYVVGFTLGGILMRIFGKDPLDRRWAPRLKTSYWRNRDVLPQEDRDLKPY